jgi:RNA polymerase sigma factor (sigma-70 family)
MNTSVNNSSDAVQCTKEKNPLEKILTKVIDLDREIEKDEMALVELKAEVWEQLDKLTDERQKRILWLRYAEHKKSNSIADDLELSPRHVRRLHRKALENFEKIL